MKFIKMILSFFFKIRVKSEGFAPNLAITTLHNGYNYTSISDLISVLETAKNNLGDIPVVIHTDRGNSSCINGHITSYYMDGGFLLQKGVNENNKPNWVTSKKGFSTPATFPASHALVLSPVYIDRDHSYKGIEVQNLDPSKYKTFDELENFQRSRFGGVLPSVQVEALGDEYHFVASVSNGLKGYGKTRSEAMDVLERKIMSLKS